MKVLVGAACVAVLAFVGYFFWNEWQDRLARERAMELVTRLAEQRGAERLRASQNIELLTATAPESRKAPGAMCRHLLKIEGDEALGSYSSYIEDCRTLGLIP